MSAGNIFHLPQPNIGIHQVRFKYSNTPPFRLYNMIELSLLKKRLWWWFLKHLITIALYYICHWSFVENKWNLFNQLITAASLHLSYCVQFNNVISKRLVETAIKCQTSTMVEISVQPWTIQSMQLLWLRPLNNSNLNAFERKCKSSKSCVFRSHKNTLA